MSVNNEKKLFEIAKETYKLNKGNLDGLKLTGSLMLYARGFNKRRDSTDIDFICDNIYEEDSGSPIAPDGFELNLMDGSRSAIECVQFVNEDGIKIEFMASEEYSSEIIDDVPCAGLDEMIHAKLLYARNDTSIESRNKHLDDVLYLFEHNEIS